jgi:hypothetical protein
MKRIFVLLLLITAGLCVQAQQYFIRYDIAGEDIKYYEIKKNGDTANIPVINLSRSNKVNLKLYNLPGSFRNAIEYKIKIESNETIVNPFWGGDLSGTSGLSFLKKYTDKLYQSTGDIQKSGIDFDKTAREKFVSDYNTFIEAYNSWTKAALFDQDCKTLWKELAGLRYSVQHTEAEVKHTAQKKATQLFPGINENSTSIQIAEWVADQDPGKLQDLLKKAYEKISVTHRELTFPDKSVDSLKMASQKLMTAANNYTYSTGENNVSETVRRITILYGQIMKDSYFRTIPLTIEKNTTAAIIKLTPVIDTETLKLLNIEKDDTIQRVITIYKKSPIRFRNTFGVSFVSYSENRWHYFVKSSNGVNTLERESADVFLPVVTTYLHFYSPRDKGFRWGGSFGAGITLGGGENDNNNQLNMMLGISTFLGRNDPVCISVGICGARVKKLSGYKVGDIVSFQELEDKHYNTVYRNGYFIALTFNPGGLNAKD